LHAFENRRVGSDPYVVFDDDRFRRDGWSIMLSTRVNTVENKAIERAISKSGEDKTIWLRNAIIKAAQD
jgi:hypothetical protein